MNTKKCVTCHETKQVEMFSKHAKSKRGDGLQDRCKACVKAYYDANKEKHKARTSKNSRDRRIKMRPIYQEMKNKPCVDCGIQYPPYVMDFDHIGTDKIENVSKLMNSGISQAKVLLEIAKCELVCANCHRIRTWERSHIASLV